MLLMKTTLLTKKMDGNGILYVFQRGMDEVYDLTDFPYQTQIVKEEVSPNTQTQIVKEEVSPNTQIGEVTQWPIRH